ncbi:MAG TPA: hypothetical protein VHO91_09265 [Rhodopila sp.]|nr:hypothetical protein [Rhodopila sp.]
MSIAALVSSPHLIDLVLGFTLLEGALLIWWRRRAITATAPEYGRAGARPVSDVFRLLLPGLFLMLALRAALAGAAWPWVPTALAASFIAHVIDLRGRWRR